MIRKIVYPILIAVLLYSGFTLLGADFPLFIRWWLLILIMGIIFLPMARLLFPNFVDQGYLFSKPIAIGVLSYSMWFSSSLHILKFRTIPSYLILVLGMVANFGIWFWRHSKGKRYIGESMTLRMKVREKVPYLTQIIGEEILFFGVFLLLVYIKGFKADVYGTEKFMDYGFMTTIMRTDYMPPQDLWFSGSSLNYYYVGQFIATYLTRLAGVGTEVGYNLMLMMIAAFSLVLPYSIGYHLIRFHRIQQGKKSGNGPWISGVLSGLGVTVAGTMYYPVFRFFVPWFSKHFMDKKWEGKYWFPNATRYIGYIPETNDKTIHEFPSYSFILGDLHAHVINIIFVLTVVGILLSWLWKRSTMTIEGRSLWQEILQPTHIILGFFIGLFHMTNYWDFPIYYVVSGAIILFSNGLVYNFKIKAVWLTGLQGIFIFLMGMIISLPFTYHFRTISAVPMITVNRTPWYQLLVIWGLPAFVFLFFFYILLQERFMLRRKLKLQLQEESFASKDNVMEHQSWQKSFLIDFMKNLTVSDLFILTIGLCALGLVLLPEVIYIRDIYSGDYKRANTMFKLTYQAFILLGISMGYIYVRFFAFRGRWSRKVRIMIAFLCFLVTFGYSVNGVKAWFGNVFKPSGYEGLDGTTFMEDLLPEDDLGTKWLMENIIGTPVVLEANGDSYSKYQRISVITGLPTIMGWYTHENLWQTEVGGSNSDVLEKLDTRVGHVEEIYTSEDEKRVRELIEYYDVSYIYVGVLEEEKYGVINHQLLRGLGTVVFETANQSGGGNTYIVEVVNRP